jgi:hypothetical protein
MPGSEAAQSSTYGLLALALRPDGYSWRFVPVAGSRYRDTGSTDCR